MKLVATAFELLAFDLDSLQLVFDILPLLLKLHFLDVKRFSRRFYGRLFDFRALLFFREFATERVEFRFLLTQFRLSCLILPAVAFQSLTVGFQRRVIVVEC